MRAVYQARPSILLTVNDAAANAPVRTSIRRASSPARGNQAGRSRRGGTQGYSISSEVAAKIRAALAERRDQVRIKIHIAVESKPVFGANVIGLLEGSDPALKHEVVGIGAHLDHTGRSGTQINNGADDDGSGSVGVLAIARAFQANGTRPRRSILFMCFAGEEKGLIGSGYYASNPVIPHENMVAMLQLDMIGRDEESVDRLTGEVREAAADNVNVVHPVGSQKLSMDLHEICLAKNAAHVGLDFEYDQEGVWGASDHAQFARKDIPVIFFFTGFHRDYHRPTDTIEKINFPKMVRIIQLTYAIAFEAADRSERIRRDRKYSEIQRTRRSR